MYRALSMTLVLVAVMSVPARAADKAEGQPAPLADAVATVARDMAPAMPSWAVDRSERRPAALPALYGTYAALQILDVVSTKKAITAGAIEANPLLKSGGQTRTLAIKAATGAATMFFTERAWKKNRVGAIVLMAALNGATAAVVARNARHAGR